MDADRQFFADNRTAACGDLSAALDIPRIAARWIVDNDLWRKPLRRVMAQRVKPANAEKRIEACQLWGSQSRSGELGEKTIFSTEERISRLGACPGGNQNFVIYDHKETKSTTSRTTRYSERAVNGRAA